MEIKTLFFDTYALYEIIEGNPVYKKYLQDIVIITTRLNLMELYYGLLTRHNKKIADKYYDEFKKYIIKISDKIIKEAMIFKSLNKKLSYIDCVGYVIAKENNMKFLTGDREFKGLPNVEFVR